MSATAIYEVQCFKSVTWSKWVLRYRTRAAAVNAIIKAESIGNQVKLFNIRTRATEYESQA